MKFKRVACFTALVALTAALVEAGGAKAIIVNVNGQDYDVTTFTGSYNGSTSNFNTPANGGVMPWWGNSTLAQQFVTAVGSSIAGSNLGAQSGGPFFPYSLITGGIPPSTSVANFYYLFSTGSVTYSQTAPSFNFIYAQAALVPPPPSGVPGPLPLLGAATAFGMSRRLRRRIASQPQKL